jgi:hypothetical protein
MATNAASGGDPDERTFPTALPIEVPYRSRLSWELGTRVVDDDVTESLFRWERDDGWALAVFRATKETIIARFETPIGRELFYGAEIAARTTLRSRLAADPHWQRVD